MYVSSQYPTSLDNSRMTWDNKRGWSIPRQSIDSVPMLIGFSCIATLGGKEYQSADYLIHTTGKKTQTLYLCYKLCRVQSPLVFQPKCGGH